jgi:ABC-type multidrug transport system ATPase subunit
MSTQTHLQSDDVRAMLELVGLEVHLGQRRLKLDGPCTLSSDRLYLVVGPSGSGKSSFARALLGFGDLSEPTIQCHGHVVITDNAGNRQTLWNEDKYDPTVRQHIGFLPQAERLGFLDGLSITDNLALFSDLAGDKTETEIERLARQFHLDPLPERLASASGGERIRLSAIRGLIPRNSEGGMPAVIIADEPTAGLDRVSAESMVRSLVDLARSRQTVVLVITHEPESFVGDAVGNEVVVENVVRIVECAFDGVGAKATGADGGHATARVAAERRARRNWFRSNRIADRGRRAAPWPSCGVSWGCIARWCSRDNYSSTLAVLARRRSV